VSDLSILMPVYNERATVEEAIAQALAADLPVDDVQLVVVDDGSQDGTRELLLDTDWPQGVKVLTHDGNRGKGAAVRTALDAANGRYAAIMDADLEYDPNDLRRLLEPLIDGRAQVVYGTRGFDSHASFSFWYVLGNKLVTMAANVLYNSWLADIMTCHKVMPTETWRSLDLRSRGFTIEPEITAKILMAGHRIYEVPITYNARSREEGKKLTAMDGVRTLATLFAYRLRGNRVKDVPRSSTSAR
jgi:glycosyltransferase involved in cell wall biosynthesis